MVGNPQSLADRLRSEGEKVIAAFDAYPEESREVTVYTEGAHWRLRDVLAHFVSTEIAFLQLFKNIQLGGSGVPDDFSIDQYNEKQVADMKEQPFVNLLESFTSTRAAMAEWVGELSESDLELMGRHPFLGVTNLAEMIKLVYLHNNLHLRDIRKRVSNHDAQ